MLPFGLSRKPSARRGESTIESIYRLSLKPHSCFRQHRLLVDALNAKLPCRLTEASPNPANGPPGEVNCRDAGKPSDNSPRHSFPLLNRQVVLILTDGSHVNVRQQEKTLKRATGFLKTRILSWYDTLRQVAPFPAFGCPEISNGVDVIIRPEYCAEESSRYQQQGRDYDPESLPTIQCTHRAFGRPNNQDYLVPYRTAFLLYITVRVAVTRTASTMGTMICKVFCDDPIRQRLKTASVYSGASEFGVYYRAQTVSTATYSLATTIQYGANAEPVPDLRNLHTSKRRGSSRNVRSRKGGASPFSSVPKKYFFSLLYLLLRSMKFREGIGDTAFRAKPQRAPR